MKNFNGISPWWVILPCVIMMFSGGSLFSQSPNDGIMSTQSQSSFTY